MTKLELDPFSKQNIRKSFITGERHPIYHHDLKHNLDNEAGWGEVRYRICTNEYGFKISCDDKGKKASKDYDIAFIGDSFTEAVGMAYEDSFVGMYAKNNPQFSVVNLGVASYAPSIYYKKMEYLLNNGFHFKHVIVLPDISDIQDEAVSYVISDDGSAVVDKPTDVVLEVPIKNPLKNIWAQHFKYAWFINVTIYDWLNPPKLQFNDFDSMPSRAGWTYNAHMPRYGKDGVQGGIAQSVKGMEMLKDLLDKHNIKMSVAVYPWPAQLKYNKPNHLGVTLWKEFCERVHCVNFVDANTEFYKELEQVPLLDVVNKYYIPGDFHYNRAGNEVVYRALNAGLKNL